MTQRVRIAKEPPVIWKAAVVGGRFVSGRPLDGSGHRTDATWTHKGSKSFGDHRAWWWHYQTKTTRVGARLGAAGATLGTGYGLWTDADATLNVLHNGGVSAGSVAVAAIAYKATDAALAWRHNHDYVWPLHLVLKEALGWPEGTRPRHYMTVPRDFNTVTGDAIWIELPAASVLSPEIRARVETALREKLALQEVRMVWQTTGADHHVAVRQLPRPPKRATMDEEYVRRAVEAAEPDAPVIGISHSGKAVAQSIDTDSPHVLIIMGTGGGKSVLLRTISAQLMHHGAEIVLLDYKQTSQPYMRRIRGIRYARSIEAIHEALLYVGESAQERRAATAEWIDSGGDPEKDGSCPHITHRLCVFFEEINSTIGELKKYWDRIKGKDDPKESPALTAYFQALNMGRSEKVHFFSVGQSGKEQEIGPRNNYGLRILGAYDKKTWNLIAEAGTAPKKSGEKGRVQVIANGATKETQVVFFSNEQAIEWATTGTGRTASQPSASAPEAEIAEPLPGEVDAPPLDGSHAHTHAPWQEGLPRETAPEAHAQSPREPLPPNVVPFARPDPAEHGQDPEPAPEIDLVNMAEASQDKGRGILPMNHDAIRQAKRSDPDFPAPDGKVQGKAAWKPETLKRWHQNRPRTASKG